MKARASEGNWMKAICIRPVTRPAPPCLCDAKQGAVTPVGIRHCRVEMRPMVARECNMNMRGPPTGDLAHDASVSSPDGNEGGKCGIGK